MEDLFRRSESATAASLARSIIERERARSNLIDFARFVDGNYVPFALHRFVARKLEDVESGRLRRLAIFVPPAVGKSRLASELFPAWCFGRNPRVEVIAASYDAALAFSFGRSVRNTVLHPQFRLLFPGVDVAADASAMHEWKTTAGGEYKAEGVGGGLIGFHAHVAIIDDPFKNYEAAASLNNRRAVWDWYSSVLLNRLRPYADGPGAVVLIMQRWHDDDLGGRIEKLALRGEESWDIVSLPSIAEADDQLGRAPGDVLLPEGPNRRTIEELTALRARNPRLFMALHQQKPIADEGDLFNPSWLRPYSLNDVPKNLAIYGSSDFALSEGSGDYTVHILFGVCSAGHVWILDLWRKQSGILEGVEQCVAWMKERRARRWFFERVGLNKVIGPLVRKRKAELSLWTLLDDVSVVGLGGKASDRRAGAIAGAMQMGFVHVPENAPWLGELEFELSRFPNGRYDDQVDTLSLIGIKLSELRGRHGKKAQPDERDRFVLKETSFTFSEMVDRNKRARLGRNVRRGAPILRVAERTVLDEVEAA